MKIEMCYNEIENASKSDVMRVALMTLGGPTIAIEDTLAECLETAKRIGATKRDEDGDERDITADDVDTRTDRRYLNSNSLVAVDIIDTPAAQLGRRGGLARSAALTAEQRTASAKAAATARWAKKARNWYVCNDRGDVSGHDMDEASARANAQEMNERETGANYEALQAD